MSLLLRGPGRTACFLGSPKCVADGAFRASSAQAARKQCASGAPHFHPTAHPYLSADYDEASDDMCTQVAFCLSESGLVEKEGLLDADVEACAQ